MIVPERRYESSTTGGTGTPSARTTRPVTLTVPSLRFVADSPSILKPTLMPPVALFSVAFSAHRSAGVHSLSRCSPAETVTG